MKPDGEIAVVELTPKQELFCQYFASDKEFFGNGTQAYIEAYDTLPKDYMSAAASASRLLKDVKVLQRIDQLLELRGLNDSFVDKQLELLVTQNADYKSKMSAIKEYNNLKARTAKRGDEGGNTYNTFIQQNNINPNTPDAKTLVDSTLDMLMNSTKRHDTNQA